MNGNYVWAKAFVGNDDAEGWGIAVDPSGNVYTGGIFWGTIDFDPGSGTDNLTSPSTTSDGFVSKLDSSGNFVWAGQLGGTGDDQVTAIALDPAGDLCATGYFQTTADFDPGPGTANLTSAGGEDIFVARLNAQTGGYIWAGKMGGASDDEGLAIATDAAGDIYTTGYFQSTANFNPGSGTLNLTSAGYTDAFLSELTLPALPQTFTFSAATSGTFTAGQNVTIQWTATNILSGSDINLCYDTGPTWNAANEQWIEVSQVPADYGTGTYTWNTAGVAPGTYYIAGYLWTGSAAIYSHLTQSITIQAAPIVPSFTITGPTSGTFTAGQTVPIDWTAGNVGTGATVSLCYDTAPTWWTTTENWIEVSQVPATNGTGSYSWNTTGVATGTYYLAGYLWSGGQPTFFHLTQSITIQAPPTFTITSPTSGSFPAGQNVSIQWTASNVGTGATVSLCYDEDTTWWNGNEHWIEVGQAPAAEGAGNYSWNTTGVAPGTYYLAGYLWSGGQPTFFHSDQSITIQASPTFTITSPTSGSFPAGQTVSIQWTASNVGTGATVSLCYDEDTTWWNGNEHWIEVGQAPAAEGQATIAGIPRASRPARTIWPDTSGRAASPRSSIPTSRLRSRRRQRLPSQAPPPDHFRPDRRSRFNGPPAM